jgi:hypothetical protein
MSIKSKRVRLKSKRKSKRKLKGGGLCETGKTPKECNLIQKCKYNKKTRSCNSTEPVKMISSLINNNVLPTEQLYDIPYPYEILNTENYPGDEIEKNRAMGEILHIGEKETRLDSFKQFKNEHDNNQSKKYDAYILDFELPASEGIDTLEAFGEKMGRFPTPSYRDNYYEQYLTMLEESSMNDRTYKYYINLFDYWVEILYNTQTDISEHNITETNLNNVVSYKYWSKRETDNKVSSNVIEINKHKNYFQRNIHRLNKFFDKNCKYKLLNKQNIMRVPYKSTNSNNSSRKFINRKLNPSEKLWCRFLNYTQAQIEDTSLLNKADLKQVIETNISKLILSTDLIDIYSVHMLEYIYILVCKINNQKNPKKKKSCMGNLKVPSAKARNWMGEWAG